MLDQYTAFEMLTPNEKFKKYVERKFVKICRDNIFLKENYLVRSFCFIFFFFNQFFTIMSKVDNFD